MWNTRTKGFVEAGKLRVIGVLEEQHFERAALYAQWQRFDFPMLWDPLNVMDVAVVPIHLLVDGGGVIRYRNPSEADFKEFMAANYEVSGRGGAGKLGGVGFLAGDRLVMEGKLDEALKVYDGMKDVGGRLHFRRGVVWRMKFDAGGDPADFGRAVRAWRDAREVDGGQYIWRRRIQQYGPQSDKPYPFYDWVATAEKEVRARGEVPVKLSVNLTASELASPKGEVGVVLLEKEPDAKGELVLDDGDFEVLPVVLPATDGKKGVYRVHLVMRPKGKFSWNNEGGAMEVWLGEGDGHVKGFSMPVNAEVATSSEVRDGEFEWVVKEGQKQISGYVVFHVCEKESGVCTVMRKSFEVAVPE